MFSVLAEFAKDFADNFIKSIKSCETDHDKKSLQNCYFRMASFSDF